MKTRTKFYTALMASLLVAGAAQAALYTSTYNSGFANNGIIPDGNPTGWSDTRTLSGIIDVQITDVNVTLTLSSGYNGDLYAYLVHDGGFAVLLNRVGAGAGGEPTYSFGYSTAGFNNVTLDDQSLNGNIHGVETPMSGISYLSDGGTLSSFNNLNPNGTWTLFFADLAGGDLSQSTITSWQLDITAIPEPTNTALAVCGCVAGLIGGCRWWRCRKECARSAGEDY